MRQFVALALAVVVGSGCLESESSTTHRSSVHEAAWTIVALGDADALAVGDPSGLGWVERYARLVRARVGIDVVVTNLARNGQTSQALAAAVRSDPPTQGAIAKAEVVLIGIGQADLAPGDARLAAGACKANACYASDLFGFRDNIEIAAAEVRHVLRSPDVVLRAITLPNVAAGADGVSLLLTPEIGAYRSESMRRSICRAMAMYRGRCVDVLRAFNGPDATQDAYARAWLTTSPCCYPTAAGHQAIAQLVFKTGFTSPG